MLGSASGVRLDKDPLGGSLAMPVTESLSTAVLVKETRKRKLLIIPALISGLSIFDRTYATVICDRLPNLS